MTDNERKTTTRRQWLAGVGVLGLTAWASKKFLESRHHNYPIYIFNLEHEIASGNLPLYGYGISSPNTEQEQCIILAGFISRNDNKGLSDYLKANADNVSKAAIAKALATIAFTKADHFPDQAKELTETILREQPFTRASLKFITRNARDYDESPVHTKKSLTELIRDGYKVEIGTEAGFVGFKSNPKLANEISDYIKTLDEQKSAGRF